MKKLIVTNSGDRGDSTPIVIHAYQLDGKGALLLVYFYQDDIAAKEFARRLFKRQNVWKVRVWDRRLGAIIPNRLNPVALILELI